MFEVQMTIANPQYAERTTSITMLAGTRAVYSIVPRQRLEEIGLKPLQREEFETVDGVRTERDVGEATICWNGKRGTSPVVFGEASDFTLLGSLALASLALQIDPVDRALRPAKLLLY